MQNQQPYGNNQGYHQPGQPQQPGYAQAPPPAGGAPYGGAAPQGTAPGYQPQYGQAPQPPQGQYGAPPPQAGQPPYGQQQAPYGQQQAPYGQQQAPYGQQQQQPYGAAQYGQPAPPQGQYGSQPPAGQYGQPPQPQYGQPPQSQYGQPQYGQPQYGQPAYGQGYAAPPQGQYYPQQQQQAPMMGQQQQHIPTTYLGAIIHPSTNYLLPQRPPASTMAQSPEHADLNGAVDQIRKATKGFGTKDSALISALTSVPSIHTPTLAHTYKQKHGKDLEDLLKSELSGKYEDVMVGYLQGPVLYDVNLLRKATDRVGTDEEVLTEVLVARTPNDMDLLRAAFPAVVHRSLESVIKDELSFKTKSAFNIAMLGEWRDQVNNGRGPQFEQVNAIGGFAGPQQGPPGCVLNEAMLEQDVKAVVHSMRMTVTGEQETDPVALASVLFARSPLHLYHLQQKYLATKRQPLTRQVKVFFSGHLKDAFLHALNSAKKDMTGVYGAAKGLHNAMKGAGTNDSDLIMRVLRASWDKGRFRLVQAAYQAKHKKPLSNSVMNETSGDYRSALMAIIAKV